LLTLRERMLRSLRQPSYQKRKNHVDCFLFSLAASGKELPLPMQETQKTWVPSLGWEDPLEEDMATHSSILAWRIPWTEEPRGL